MANLTVYANEPSTHGKVVVHTSVGPLDVELWSKQAPLATRNFTQLCVEGYYDGCSFHRVIKGFMAQTGDPTGSGKGGESVYGGTFKDEIHGRLRFTHRGLLAMASSGPNTNGSQFFITLDRCEWLDGKHTIFGKVTGNSLYNLPRFDDLETDEKDRPLFPPRIERTEILLEPFDDIVPRAKAPPVEEPPKKKKRKEKKNLSLLSFGEEAAAEDKALERVSAKVVSSHDALDDPRLSKQHAVDVDQLEMKKREAEQAAGKRAAAHDALASASLRAGEDGGDGGDLGGEDAFEERMRQQMREKQRRLKNGRQAGLIANGVADSREEEGRGSERGREGRDVERGKEREGTRKPNRAEAMPETGGRDGDAGRAYKWRGKGAKDSDDEESDEESDAGAGGMTELERQRAKYLQRKRESAGLTKEQRQKATMQKLMGFKKSLDKEESEWKAHQLKFERERREAESASRYDSYDPLKHGGDDERAKSKIKEREKTMMSLKRADGGTFDTSGWDD